MNTEKAQKNTFEAIKHLNADGQEYWLAREFAKVLDYSDYRNFLAVIAKAKKSCKNSQQEPLEHFVDVTNMVKIGSETARELNDISLASKSINLYTKFFNTHNSELDKILCALTF